MALPIVINGAVTLVPGVYSSFTVQNSLPAPAPAGRSVAIMGESSEGLPGAEMDLSKNFFTSFDDVQDFYKDGPIVKAARMLFSNQPGAVFNGSIQRLYVYKTNNSTRASKAISAPANFGSILASRYGEAGNMIKSQIKTGQAESLPSKTFNHLPSPQALDFAAVANGIQQGPFAMASQARASALVTLLAAAPGLSASGGTNVSTFTGAGPMTVDLTASGDIITITRSAGVETFNSSIAVGDSLYMVAGSPISGGADENAGAYIVTAITTTTLSAKQISHHDGATEVAPVAFDPLAGVSLAAADLLINKPITVSVDYTTAAGQAASLEILEDGGATSGLSFLYREADMANATATATSAIAAISATVPSADKLLVSLSLGSWLSTPKVGDLAKIERDSLLEGAAEANVGLYVVESASAKTVTLARLITGLGTVAVASVDMASANSTLKFAPGFVSSLTAARRIDSSAERKVKLEASRSSDGAQFPADLIGGNTALELSYYDASATAAALTINSNRKMSIVITGGPATIELNLKKYDSLQDLVDVLNAQAGVSAKLSAPSMASLPTSALDMVTSLGCLSHTAIPAYNCKIKKDYYDWKQFFADNTALLAFQEGSMSLKAGLPDAEAVASFLSGATIGSTSNASVQAGLDAALKVSVRQVVPLFSRDATQDIADGLTDESSSYTIDSINAACKAHVATASASIMNKRRFALVSIDGSFEDAKLKAGELGYERMQMSFQRHSAAGDDGELELSLPWVAACAVAAGRSQAILGTSMLRKPFLLSSAEHTGLPSLYDESLVPDFDPEDRPELEEAINAGLLVFRTVPGFGVRMESPDLSTRSRVNDPQGWVFERVSVLFTCDEVIETCQSVLENFIGERTSDVPVAVVQQALKNTLASFTVGSGNGSLLSAQVLSVVSLGNQYKAKIKVQPAEALEAIVLDVEAVRSI